MRVQLTYFKPSGKYYTDGSYDSQLEDFYNVIEEVRQMRRSKLPGLIGGWTGAVLVAVDGLPHLLPEVVASVDPINTPLNRVVIVVDFDGTIVQHKYPHVGEEAPGAIECLKRLQQRGASIVLWTMRSGMPLADAMTFLAERGVVPDAVNTQESWTTSEKPYGHVYIDDRAVGIPCWVVNGHKVVDWPRLESLLEPMLQECLD